MFNNNIDNEFALNIERLHLAEYYFNIKDFTNFTLSLEIFFESFVLYVLSKINEYKVNLNKNSYNVEKLLKIFEDNHEENAIEFANILDVSINELKASFPTQILITEYYAKQNNYKNILSLIELIKSTNAKLNKKIAGIKGLDGLRNKIAHEGKGVKEEDLIKIANNKDINWWSDEIIKKIKDIITPNQDNLFEEMNKEIISIIEI